MALRVVPPPAGTHDIGRGFREGSLAFGQGIAAGFQQRAANKAAERQQQLRQEKFQQDMANLAAFQRQQQLAQQTQLPSGSQGPQAQQPDLTQLIMQTPQGQNLALQLGFSNVAQPKQISPSQQITQKQLDRINLLERKQRQGTITEPEKVELQRSLARGGPLVQFGALPGASRFLTPAERKEQAKQPLRKPLTSTEVKGVDATVEAILPKPKSLPFGVRRGPAVKQSEMEASWEQVMLETGYEGRSKVAQKQIESRFDRKVNQLNKGKGVGVLGNQYQWDRKKWEKKQRKPGETIDDFVKRTGL